MLTIGHITEVFEQAPQPPAPAPAPYTARATWFNHIAWQLFEFQSLPLRTEAIQREAALVEWKANSIAPVIYDRPVVVQFDGLYINLLRHLSDNFTVVNFQSELQELWTYGKQCTDQDIAYKVRYFLNTICGQLHYGYVRHNNATFDAIVVLGRSNMQKLYDHNNAIYVDTDTVIFTDVSVDQVFNIVEGSGIDSTLLHYDLHEYDRIRIDGKKRVTYFK